MRCDLQIFSGCVCHLEQLHAQSPFLFPIVFSVIIFNESLATGVLPDEFKTGNISPILKPGKTDNSTASSHRGISLTCVLAKVLEKIVHQQLEAHLHKIGKGIQVLRWFQEKAFMCRSFTCNDRRLDDRKRSHYVNVCCLH